MKKSRRLAVLLCLLAALAGCGQKKEQATESTTIFVDRKGALTYCLVGDFDKDYYSLSELSDMAVDEAAKFNSGAQDKASVTVESVEQLAEDADKVRIIYRFAGYESFNQFGAGIFFYGTVEEAFRQGYIGEPQLKSVKDETVKAKEQLRQEGAKKIIITDEKAVIYCPAKVTYFSGALLQEDGSVDASASDQRVYILLK